MTQSLRKKLVFVVGAGASFEVGLPLGKELKKDIAQFLGHEYTGFSLKRDSGSPLIDSAYRHIEQNFSSKIEFGSLLRAGWSVRDGMHQASSIDNYLDAHKDNQLMTLVAKLAISEIILTYEKKSLLYLNPLEQINQLDFEKLETKWYGHLFKLLVDGCQLNNIAQRLSKLAFIIFNYDRCIEQFLHEALMNYYRIDSQYAAELLGNLTIFHPYGYLGELKWPSVFPNVGFGGKIHAHQLVTISQKIKTFTEGTDEDSSEIIQIRDCIDQAEKIAFLGFAFARQNLELLFNLKQSNDQSLGKVFGTAFGMSNMEVQIIKSDLIQSGRYYPDNVYIDNKLKCFELFEQCSRALSLV
jgi:hypothetical protein